MKQQMYCSPGRYEMGVKDNTCLTTGELKAIARSYNQNGVNASGKRNATNARGKKIKIVDDKQQLVKQMAKELSPKCGEADHCWVQQNFVDASTKAKIMSKAFRPLKPVEWYKDNQTWLNTFDIQKVMQQYEDKHRDFFFLGVFPIDFKEKDEYGYCVAPGMCEFDLKKVIEKGKKRFAMVLNLDKHNESGSHWVAMYCNLNPRRKNFGVFYYDSVAYPPPREAASFMKEVERQAGIIFSKKVADRFVMRYNRVQKQYEDTECGVYSEVFLTQMLKDIGFDEICKRMKKDGDINKLRNMLYTPVA